MSEQYEPSYYEIALTGRQVLVAFVILLVCLVAAFFSGVWVGRGEIGGDGSRAVAERVDEPAESSGGADGEESAPPEEPPEREELSFFEEGRDQPGDGVPRDGGEAAPPPGVPEPAREDSTEPSPPERTDEQASEEGGGDLTGTEEEPEAETGSERPASPRETVNPSGTLAGGDVVIQVFSSADEAKAQEILERLHANDFRAFISPVSDGGETFYRVRVGPFEHQEDADRVASELRRRLDLDTWITR